MNAWHEGAKPIRRRRASLYFLSSWSIFIDEYFLFRSTLTRFPISDYNSHLFLQSIYKLPFNIDDLLILSFSRRVFPQRKIFLIIFFRKENFSTLMLKTEVPDKFFFPLVYSGQITNVIYMPQRLPDYLSKLFWHA